MTNFECCRTKCFPLSYYICVNCFRVFHKSCTLKDKTKYVFLEGFKIKCCDISNILDVSRAEKSCLEETISELTENSVMQDQYISKIKKEHERFIQEATQREEEMNIYMKKQDELLKKAESEIAKLKNDMALFQNKVLRSQYTQTWTQEKAVKQTQTESTSGIRTQTSDIQIVSHCLKTSECRTHSQGKLLLITGHHGRELVHYLRRYVDNIAVSSIIKPNASNAELLETAISNTKLYTKNDIIILWPNVNCSWMSNSLTSKLSHTNFIILSTPYRFDYSALNEKIYFSNLSLFMKTHANTGNLNNLLEINSILRSSNYKRDGFGINKTGKKYIAAHLVRKVKNFVNYNVLTESHIIYNTQLKSKSSANDQENFNKTSINQKEETEVQNFLYPRLSQYQIEEI